MAWQLHGSFLDYQTPVRKNINHQNMKLVTQNSVGAQSILVADDSEEVRFIISRVLAS